MISDRLMQIVMYLKKHKETSYRELAEVLNIKERQVRYDIDRINNTLKEHDQPLIQRMAKGLLRYEHGDQIDEFFEKKPVMYNQEQRIDFILLIALLEPSTLNLRILSEKFSVSRSSVKNDVKAVCIILKEYDCSLVYKSGFELLGSDVSKLELMIREFSKYVYMYGRKRVKFNAYELYAKKIIQHAFHDIDVKSTITWIKEFLEHQRCILSDASFCWYVSSIMIILWYAMHHKIHPLEVIDCELDYESDDFTKLEDIIHMPLTSEKKKLIQYLLRYTNHEMTRFSPSYDAIKIVCEIIALMEEKENICFGDDDILYEGLLHQVESLLLRLRDEQNLMNIKMIDLPEKERFVYQDVCDCLDKIELFKKHDKGMEAMNIAMHFLASIHRKTQIQIKRIVLVCGLESGMTTYLKQVLISNFQIEIVDVIPSYKLQFYQKWKQVDLIISVLKIEIDCVRPIVQIQPFITDRDISNLLEAGIHHRSLLPTLYQVQEDLHVLEESNQKVIMNILKKSFGYRNVPSYKKESSLHCLFSLRSMIQCTGEMDIHMILNKLISVLYEQEIITSSFHRDLLDIRELKNDTSSCLLIYNKKKDHISSEGIIVMKLKIPLLYFNHKISFVICGISSQMVKQIPFMQRITTLLLKDSFIDTMNKTQTKVDMYKTMLLYDHITLK